MWRFCNRVLDALALLALAAFFFCLLSADLGGNVHWLRTPIGQFGPFQGPVYPEILAVMAVSFLILISWGVISVVKFWTYRRRMNRAIRGRCVHCGYDLRASPDRCP